MKQHEMTLTGYYKKHKDRVDAHLRERDEKDPSHPNVKKHWRKFNLDQQTSTTLGRLKSKCLTTPRLEGGKVSLIGDPILNQQKQVKPPQGRRGQKRKREAIKGGTGWRKITEATRAEAVEAA